MALLPEERKALLVLAAVGLAGAGVWVLYEALDDDREPQTIYCVDDQNMVVSPEGCDDDGMGYGGSHTSIIVVDGHTSYAHGHKVEDKKIARKVAWNDKAGRESIGVAPNGKPVVGTRMSAGIGKGPSGGSSGG
ncbi:MAG TPA: hypothetical protein VD907_00240 [Verrucomicrobiae bacterium]|nr:hypothetical protein [Verrucomicrobiae bacterium]